MEMTCHPRLGGAVVPKAYGGGHRNQLPLFIFVISVTQACVRRR